MLDRLFIAPAITAIAELLGAARVDGRLAIVGNAKLAAAFAKRGEVVAVGLPPGAVAKAFVSVPDFAGIDRRSLAAVIGVDPNETSVEQWAPYLRDGGAIIVVERLHTRTVADASRRALCAGLTSIEQRRLARLVVTSGLVTHLS